MKKLSTFLFFTLSLNSYAECSEPYIPLSYAEAVEKASSIEEYANIKFVTCKEKPNEQCFCYDGPHANIKIETVFETDPDTGINIEKKVLRNSPEKKAAFEAKQLADEQVEQAKKDKKALALEKIKAVKKSDLTSNAKTVEILMEVLELLK